MHILVIRSRSACLQQDITSASSRDDLIQSQFAIQCEDHDVSTGEIRQQAGKVRISRRRIWVHIPINTHALDLQAGHRADHQVRIFSHKDATSTRLCGERCHRDVQQAGIAADTIARQHPKFAGDYILVRVTVINDVAIRFDRHLACCCIQPTYRHIQLGLVTNTSAGRSRFGPISHRDRAIERLDIDRAAAGGDVTSTSLSDIAGSRDGDITGGADHRVVDHRIRIRSTRSQQDVTAAMCHY